MINDLRFVKGAIAKKDYQPALTHFRIKDNRVMGFNGVIALSSPIDLGVTACPKALPFIRAIERCVSAQTTLTITPGGKLTIKSGGFKAHIECLDEADILDGIKPEGVMMPVPEQLIDAFCTLEPFIGTDASRPWSNGIMLRGQSAFVTNNIVLAEYWLGVDVPEINIPESAVVEVIRVKDDLTGIQLSENNITFHYIGDRWLRSALLGTNWPQITELLDKVDAGNQKELPVGLLEAVEQLRPFLGDEKRVYFRGDRISTGYAEGEGASFELQDPIPETGAYSFEHLLSLNRFVETIDFTTHPQPCPFRGDRVRGVFLGMVDS